MIINQYLFGFKKINFIVCIFISFEKIRPDML